MFLACIGATAAFDKMFVEYYEQPALKTYRGLKEGDFGSRF